MFLCSLISLANCLLNMYYDFAIFVDIKFDFIRFYIEFPIPIYGAS